MRTTSGPRINDRLSLISRAGRPLHEKFRPKADDCGKDIPFPAPGPRSWNLRSASPAIVKSIKQRDLLNVWLRLYARQERLPRFDEYQPERIAEEADDLVSYTVVGTGDVLRFRIDSEGTRMSHTYGTTGQGRYLDDLLSRSEARADRHSGLSRMRPATPADVYNLEGEGPLRADGRLRTSANAVLRWRGCYTYPRVAEDDQRGRRF